MNYPCNHCRGYVAAPRQRLVCLVLGSMQRRLVCRYRHEVCGGIRLGQAKDPDCSHSPNGHEGYPGKDPAPGSAIGCFNMLFLQ